MLPVSLYLCHFRNLEHSYDFLRATAPMFQYGIYPKNILISESNISSTLMPDIFSMVHKLMIDALCDYFYLIATKNCVRQKRPPIVLYRSTTTKEII